jgi:hypothetical protein
MFGLVLANVAAAPPYSVKRTLRRLKPACISVIQLRKPVVPVETDPAAGGSEPDYLHGPIQSARSAGTSFTFTLTSVASVKCIKYWIVN